MYSGIEIQAGFHSAQGRRPRNEDYGVVFLGDARHGVTAALADGVGGAKGGRTAAELAVAGLIEGYYGLPETLAVRTACSRAIDPINRWIHAQGRTDRRLEGMSCTLTALIFKGRQAHLVHVGDSRAYRLREGRLARLSTDHVSDRPDTAHILLRAIGAEDGVRLDYAADAAWVDDRYLLCSDGVHGSLKESRIRDLLHHPGAAEETARALVEAALAAGSSDNATAIVVDLLALPPPDAAELDARLAALPILAPPRPGETVDGYEIHEPLFQGRSSKLFRAIDLAQQSTVAIKFPLPEIAGERVLRDAFLRESWIGTRIRNPWLGTTIEPGPDRQTRLYVVMPYFPGMTLESRLMRRPPVAPDEGLAIAIRLAKGVAALHRAGIIHRDIKPDNVILELDGGVKLIDFGVVRLSHDDRETLGIPGTPSYMAPELFDGSQGCERTDLFALGVTVYRLFSGGPFPYGEAEPFSRPRFGKPAPLSRHRPDLPAWLDPLIARALAVVPEDRPSDALEFAFALENALGRGRPPIVPKLPLYHRNPLRFWQVVSFVLLLLLILSLARR